MNCELEAFATPNWYRKFEFEFTPTNANGNNRCVCFDDIFRTDLDANVEIFPSFTVKFQLCQYFQQMEIDTIIDSHLACWCCCFLGEVVVWKQRKKAVNRVRNGRYVLLNNCVPFFQSYTSMLFKMIHGFHPFEICQEMQAKVYRNIHGLLVERCVVCFELILPVQRFKSLHVQCIGVYTKLEAFKVIANTNWFLIFVTKMSTIDLLQILHQPYKDFLELRQDFMNEFKLHWFFFFNGWKYVSSDTNWIFGVAQQ